ncbi:hypothetical protein AAFF_G00067930 [Aldrovandia affinis]|uniref:Uncharacterized protein n=1 Tax=Aldrovandia affinis TaxID=143900 RepID=A0AAD7RZN3_9TELE|nr:hypothetical protein AAFF_G00067930 [Aldrovandia affinis]
MLSSRAYTAHEHDQMRAPAADHLLSTFMPLAPRYDLSKALRETPGLFKGPARSAQTGTGVFSIAVGNHIEPQRFGARERETSRLSPRQLVDTCL